jgi:hypothetical protein
MSTYLGKWHGTRRYFGLHYDLHASKTDTDLGTRCDPKELVPMLRLMAPDWVQTDCKGHAGYVSWFSRTRGAAIPPKLRKDALEQWRAATRELHLPLHCHYSGIWDMAAGAKHHDWCIVNHQGKPVGAPFGSTAGKPTFEKMCPRSPYLDKLMIPQLLELIDRYDVDGFWIDGDLWAAEPCYCKRCRRAYTQATGATSPPTDENDPDWPRWWTFTLRSFEQYVTRYCDAVHRHKPGVLVCSNWLQTFANPGEPRVPTDWISGDNVWVYGLDGSRCEARWLSTRGKPWDIMLWNFYCSHGMGQGASPWTVKPPQMLMQEAAVLLSFGGNVQIYENPGGVRDGRLVQWRQKRLGEVSRFVRRRRALCQGGQTIPQIVVLHSEHHVHTTTRGKNLMWSVDTAPVKGAVFCLLENHFGVDILDEWALLPRLGEFPVVVAPERHAMSDAMAAALKRYVQGGGRLLVSGCESFDRFGGGFLGVTKGKVQEKATYHLPAGDGSAPLYSEAWRLVKATTARAIGWLGRKPLLDDELLPNPAATIRRVGRGAVAYVPAAIFRDFAHNRYPLTRSFVGQLVRKLTRRLGIEVTAPVCVDVAFRRKGGKTIVHLVNRSSGIPNQPNNGAVDEIPRVGPLSITMRAAETPRRVSLAFEKAEMKWGHKAGRLRVTVSAVHIHLAVVIE